MLAWASAPDRYRTDLNVLQTALNEIYLTLFIALCSGERYKNFHFRFMEMVAELRTIKNFIIC